jgi:hypothetical protein
MLTKDVFSYRLSCARKSVKCAFGILNAKFKIFEGPMCCKEENVNSVINNLISSTIPSEPENGYFVKELKSMQ